MDEIKVAHDEHGSTYDIPDAMFEPQSKPERVVDVMQRFLDGARPRLWINGREVGKIEHFRVLEVDDPVEITAGGVVYRERAYDTIEVTYG